jgi:hypothetical protein
LKTIATQGAMEAAEADLISAAFTLALVDFFFC